MEAQKDTNPPISLKDRYELIIKARNFHYDNYNKWMTYFYVMIAALFIGLYNILGKSDTELWEFKYGLVLIVCFLGYTFGILWYWANKGYYYWNINFIMLVNHYEQNIFKFDKAESVYSVFANKEIQNKYGSITSGANFSTSKISILVSYIIAFSWGVALFYLIIYKIIFLCEPDKKFQEMYPYLIACFFLSVIISYIIIQFMTIKIGKKYLKSYIDHFPDLKLEQKPYIETE